MDNHAAQNIAITLAAIVGIGLALSPALGPLVMYLVEAIKGTGKVPAGYGGIVAIVIGVLIGAGLGALTDAMAEDSYSIGVMIALGAFAGALMASGAIREYKAAGDVNTTPAMVAGKALAIEEMPAAQAETHAWRDAAPMTTQPLTQADIEAMHAELAKVEETGTHPHALSGVAQDDREAMEAELEKATETRDDSHPLSGTAHPV